MKGDSVRTLDKLAHGLSDAQVESRNGLRHRHRVIARSVASDLRLAMRDLPQWTEWQKTALRKAIQDLGEIR